MHVLYLTHNGLTEPLGQSQVLPYLFALASRGWRYSLISFEKEQTADPDSIARLHQQMREHGISWRPLRYHRRPTLAATAYDALGGSVAGLLAGRDIVLIHARSTVPAAVAYGLSRLHRARWIFDVRGLVAQEYADAGHWTRDGILFRLTARAEAGLLRRADGVVFLTERVRQALGTAQRPTAVIPCAVDTGRFRLDESARSRTRLELGLGSDPVLTYSGSLGSWYRFEEMLDFFLVAKQHLPRLRFLVLTMCPDIAIEAVTARNLQESVIVRRVKPAQMPAHLAAADAGICFLSECASKQASSPTKYAEYLATGLPVIADAWTGDTTSLQGERAWLLVQDFSATSYHAVARQLSVLLADAEGTRRAARTLAERQFGLEAAVERYDALYRNVLATHAREQNRYAR